MLHPEVMIREGIDYDGYDVSFPTISVVLEPSVHTKGTLSGEDGSAFGVINLACIQACFPTYVLGKHWWDGEHHCVKSIIYSSLRSYHEFWDNHETGESSVWRRLAQHTKWVLTTTPLVPVRTRNDTTSYCMIIIVFDQLGYQVAIWQQSLIYRDGNAASFSTTDIMLYLHASKGRKCLHQSERLEFTRIIAFQHWCLFSCCL